MAPRLAPRKARENNFSDVGKVGRRTGVTLPQRRIDVNGMEEISGIFSSPHKPSPLRRSISAAAIAEAVNTPVQTRSSRRSIPPARSASPRKSGISGTARRSKIFDSHKSQNGKENTTPLPDAMSPSTETTPRATSTRHRSSSNRSPLQDVQSFRNSTMRRSNDHEHVSIGQSDTSAGERSATSAYLTRKVPDHESETPLMFDPLPSVYDDGDDDDDGGDNLTSEPAKQQISKPKEQTVANSRKKRKSDTLGIEFEPEAVSSPAAKRAKRISDGQIQKQTHTLPEEADVQTESTEELTHMSHVDSSLAESLEQSSPSQRQPVVAPTRLPGRSSKLAKSGAARISAKQQSQLDGVVQKYKSRPNQKKSLYILRRETPANDGVTHTRSGRVSVKPLAYWRNERCIYGGSPGGASIQDGARFPLNSIKEIIRTEEVAGNLKSKKTRKGQAGKKKATNRGQSADAEQSDADEVISGNKADANAEAWETEVGTFRGTVSVWDPDQQQPTEAEEEVDLAYAPAAMETREVSGSTFRYAKLISTKFCGTGIVDLPPGALKRPKNSRRMLMSFFVATGRVTVNVGPMEGTENRFSIGRGGFWQVPRGNQYSIANEHDRPARVFFSQACEPLPEIFDD